MPCSVKKEGGLFPSLLILYVNIIMDQIFLQANRQNKYSNIIMSTQNKEVLLAILNVKKYANNLKKKASTLQDFNSDFHFNDVVSSPSIFEHQNLDEISSPLIATKSSYNQSFDPFNRQKKQHSMTNIPINRKRDDQSRNKRDLLIQPVSPSKTFTFTNTRTNLSQSYKVDSSTKLMGQTIWKKQRKDSSQTALGLEKKSSVREKNEQVLDPDSLPLNNTLVYPLNKNRDISLKDKSVKADYNPQIVQQLLNQIKKLKTEILQYRKSLILIRTKFLEMEQKCNKKSQTDHLLDVLNQKIHSLQEERQQLNQTIVKQKQKILSFQTYVLDIAQKFSSHYSDRIRKISILQTQKNVYKSLADLKLPIVEIGKENQKREEKPLKKIEKRQYSIDSESESGGQGYEGKLTLGTLCKNQKDLIEKYHLDGMGV